MIKTNRDKLEAMCVVLLIIGTGILHLYANDTISFIFFTIGFLLSAYYIGNVKGINK